MTAKAEAEKLRAEKQEEERRAEKQESAWTVGTETTSNSKDGSRVADNGS